MRQAGKLKMHEGGTNKYHPRESALASAAALRELRSPSERGHRIRRESHFRALFAVFDADGARVTFIGDDHHHAAVRVPPGDVRDSRDIALRIDAHCVALEELRELAERVVLTAARDFARLRVDGDHTTARERSDVRMSLLVESKVP